MLNFKFEAPSMLFSDKGIWMASKKKSNSQKHILRKQVRNHSKKKSKNLAEQTKKKSGRISVTPFIWLFLSSLHNTAFIVTVFYNAVKLQRQWATQKPNSLNQHTTFCDQLKI